jgi:hypothetical protein
MLPLLFPYVHNLQCEECHWASDVFVIGDCVFGPDEDCPKCGGKLDWKTIKSPSGWYKAKSMAQSEVEIPESLYPCLDYLYRAYDSCRNYIEQWWYKNHKNK